MLNVDCLSAVELVRETFLDQGANSEALDKTLELLCTNCFVPEFETVESVITNRAIHQPKPFVLEWKLDGDTSRVTFDSLRGKTNSITAALQFLGISRSDLTGPNETSEHDIHLRLTYSPQFNSLEVVASIDLKQVLRIWHDKDVKKILNQLKKIGLTKDSLAMVEKGGEYLINGTLTSISSNQPESYRVDTKCKHNSKVARHNKKKAIPKEKAVNFTRKQLWNVLDTVYDKGYSLGQMATIITNMYPEVTTTTGLPWNLFSIRVLLPNYLQKTPASYYYKDAMDWQKQRS